MIIAPDTDYNSFATYAFVSAFHEARKNADWENAVQAVAEAAIIRASDYIRAKYLLSTTAIVSNEIKTATAILARKALTQDLNALTDNDRYKSVSKAVGSLKTSKEFVNGLDAHPEVTAALAGVAYPMGAGIGFAPIIR